jgi:hypothetical protein
MRFSAYFYPGFQPCQSRVDAPFGGPTFSTGFLRTVQPLQTIGLSVSEMIEGSYITADAG